MNIFPVAIIVLVMVALSQLSKRNILRLNVVAWMVIWWLAIYFALSYGVNPPLPASIIGMFMFIVSLALAAYLTTNTEDMEAAKSAFVNFIVDPRYALPLILVMIGLPVVSAYNVYSGMTQQPQPPLSTRTIHPPPPPSITFKGKTIDLIEDENPYRALKTDNPAEFAKHVENGRRVYFQNCVYCHGDNMAGKGIFAHGFDPIPANFRDPTTIAMLQESYIFWRVAKGGPGLPAEATPWLSAMPAWEKFLSEEEIWDVIIFMYEFTNQEPRAKEELH